MKKNCQKNCKKIVKTIVEKFIKKLVKKFVEELFQRTVVLEDIAADAAVQICMHFSILQVKNPILFVKKICKKKDLSKNSSKIRQKLVKSFVKKLVEKFVKKNGRHRCVLEQKQIEKHYIYNIGPTE